MTEPSHATRVITPVPRELLRKTIHIAFGGGALLLRWLDPWQAAALSGAALLFNLWWLHPLTQGRLMRPGELERGYSWGIVLYPACVLVAILAFHRRLELAAGVWGLLAFGDGMAAITGVIANGPRLPWNPGKTWIGLAAFVLWGGAAAAFLIRWTQLGILDSRTADAASHVGPSFLATSATHAIVSQAAMLVIGCLIAALAAGLVESLDAAIDDNVTVTLVGGSTLLAATAVEPARLAAAADMLAANAVQGTAITAVLAIGAYLVRGVDRSGAIAGWILGSVLFTFSGWSGYLLLALLFAIGMATTRAGSLRKAALGIEQEQGGRRGARHALANTLVGLLAAVLAVSTPYGEPFTLAMVAAFGTATCDTVSSEIGQAYGRRFVLLTRWDFVKAGTEGAVSWIGTLGGVVAALGVALAAAAVDLIDGSATPAVVIGAFVGATVESVIGSTRIGRALGNEGLNVGNTLVGATCAVAAYYGIS